MIQKYRDVIESYISGKKWGWNQIAFRYVEEKKGSFFDISNRISSKQIEKAY